MTLFRVNTCMKLAMIAFAAGRYSRIPAFLMPGESHSFNPEHLREVYDFSTSNEPVEEWWYLEKVLNPQFII